MNLPTNHRPLKKLEQPERQQQSHASPSINGHNLKSLPPSQIHYSSDQPDIFHVDYPRTTGFLVDTHPRVKIHEVAAPL